MEEKVIYEKFEGVGFRKICLIIFSIIIGSILIRMYYFSSEIPLTSDALGYFYYASDIAIRGNLPSNYSPANPGWSMFVSGFFYLFNFETVNEYMQTQKIISIIISVITIIPIYYLCRKFLDQKLSIIGCIFFAFEPHLIQNSLLGITDPLYILLITLGLTMSLSSNKKLVFLSFAVIALSTYVRAEGLVVFLALISIILIKEKNEKSKILTLVFCILIFSLVIIPVVHYKYSVLEDDQLFMRASKSITILTDSDLSANSRLGTSIENFPKYFGWSLIPTFIIFIPIGIMSLIKNWNKSSWIILTVSFLIILPMIYAYSIPLKDTRYVMYLFPILIIISLLGVKFISEKFSITKPIRITIIIFIIISSFLFLEWKMEDYDIEKDTFLVSQIIVSSTKGVNSFNPESRYLEAAEIPSEWKNFKEYFKIDREDKKSIKDSIKNKVRIFEINNYQSLEDFITDSGLKLTHLIADDNPDRPEFIKNVYENGEDVKFLVKEFDSRDMNLNYNVKIFKINHDLLN